MLAIDGIIYTLQKHGGISVYFNELIKYINAKNIDYLLQLELPTLQDIDYNFVKAKNARIAERYRSCRLDKNINIFHSSYYRTPSRKVSSVVTIHDFTYERFVTGAKLAIHSWQKNKAIREGEALICISNSTKEDLIELVGVRSHQSVHVIHNGVSDLYKPIEDVTQIVKPFILYVGERKGYKNFKLLTQSLRFIPDVEIHCVGGGIISPEELSHLPPALSNRVKHLGFLSESQLNVVYNQALCLAYPSAYEGFGIPVAEAMKAGCPVVCLNTKAVIEVGKDALYIAEQAEPEALAQAIINTLDNNIRIEKITRGIQISQDYSWTICHQKTVEVYKSLGL